MQASEFVTELQDLIQTHGDLELVDENDEPIVVEFSGAIGTQPSVFVVTS